MHGEDNGGMNQSQGCSSCGGRMHNVIVGIVGGGGRGDDDGIGIGALEFVASFLENHSQLYTVESISILSY